MIRRDEALLARFRDACPSFAAHEVVPRFPGDDRGFGDMAELSALARHLVDLAARGDAEDFPAVFAVVDRLLVEGDDDTIAYVRTHLLEDIQNITSHRDVPVAADAFRGVLGPVAGDAWDDLDAAWRAAAAHGDEQGVVRSPVHDYLDLAEPERRELQSMTRELPDGTLASPADVLRYESTLHDHQVRSRRWRLRVVPLLLVGVALLVVAVGALTR